MPYNQSGRCGFLQRPDHCRHLRSWRRRRRRSLTPDIYSAIEILHRETPLLGVVVKDKDTEKPAFEAVSNIDPHDHLLIAQRYGVDESGCDKKVGFTRTGWSALGMAPLQVSQFHRDQRYQILPAYTQDGVLLLHVFSGATDAIILENFVAQLLQHCGRGPDPKSGLVMDYASCHHSRQVSQMCEDAGVRLVYLPPYSPDLNPIEEFFAEPKVFIKRNWGYFEANPDQGFDVFLSRCIDTVGTKKESAKGRCRHAGLKIEELAEF